MLCTTAPGEERSPSVRCAICSRKMMVPRYEKATVHEITIAGSQILINNFEHFTKFHIKRYSLE